MFHALLYPYWHWYSDFGYALLPDLIRYGGDKTKRVQIYLGFDTVLPLHYTQQLEWLLHC